MEKIMKPIEEKIREILESVEENGAIPFKGEKKYIPHLTVDQALQSILSLVRGEIEDLGIQKIIASKHIYVDGHCDTDDFVTVPIIELSHAILTDLHKKFE